MKRSELMSKIKFLESKSKLNEKETERLLSLKKRIRKLDLAKWAKNPNRRIFTYNTPGVKPINTLEYIKENPELRSKLYTKRINVTADYKSTLTRTFDVDYDFDEKNFDLINDLWYENDGGKNGGNKGFTDEDIISLTSNFQLDEIWLVTDNDGNQLAVL